MIAAPTAPDAPRRPAADRMFFVLGRGRSGTSLLRRMLNAHTDVSVAPEALFLVYLYRRFRHRTAWPRSVVASFLACALRERRLRRWSLPAADALLVRLESLPYPTLADMAAELHEVQADTEGKTPGRLLGDKNPRHSLFAEELVALYPRAKFVHLVRDYRDNVCSFRAVPFDLKHPHALAVRWVHYNASVLRAQASAPDRFLRVRFEDLVTAPSETLRTVCTFLGIGFQPSMVETATTKRNSLSPWHGTLGQPVTAHGVGRWRKELDAPTVATLDALCSPLAITFGYTPSDTHSLPPPHSKMAAVSAHVLTHAERLSMRLPVEIQGLVNDAYRRWVGLRLP